MFKRYSILMAFTLVAWACDNPVDPGTGGPGGRVYVVTLDPVVSIVRVGDSLRVTARPTAADGSLVGATVSWSSENDSVAAIRAEGTVAVIQARRPGTTWIHALADGRDGKASITVLEAWEPIDHVNVEPWSGTLRPGMEVTLEAQPRTADGSPLDGRPLTWFSTNPEVLSVSPSQGYTAVVKAKKVGEATIIASAEGVEGEAVFMVEEAREDVAYVVVTPTRNSVWEGRHTTYEVRALSTSGGEIPGAAVAVWIEDGEVAELDGPDRVRGIRQGITRIVAESDGVRGYAALTVYAFESEMFFMLTNDWGDGMPRTLPAMGTTRWTDEQGVEREAILYATSGIFSVDFDAGTWMRVVVAEAWAEVDGQLRLVGGANFGGSGTMMYRWTAEGTVSFDFVESADPQPVYRGVLRAAGELLVGLPVMGGHEQAFLFRIGG